MNIIPFAQKKGYIHHVENDIFICVLLFEGFQNSCRHRQK